MPSIRPCLMFFFEIHVGSSLQLPVQDSSRFGRFPKVSKPSKIFSLAQQPCDMRCKSCLANYQCTIPTDRVRRETHEGWVGVDDVARFVVARGGAQAVIDGR